MVNLDWHRHGWRHRHHCCTILAPSRLRQTTLPAAFRELIRSSLSGNIAITTTVPINANTIDNAIYIDTGGQFLTVNVQSGSSVTAVTETASLFWRPPARFIRISMSA